MPSDVGSANRIATTDVPKAEARKMWAVRLVTPVGSAAL
jgi:hypothetical protein